MRKLYLDLGTYVFIMLCGVVVIWEAAKLPDSMPGDLGSSFFPTALSLILIFLCALGAISAITSREDERVAFDGGVKLIVTIAALVAFFGLWGAIGYFYPLAYLFLFALLTYYACDEKLTARIVMLHAIGTAIFIGLAYLFFTEILYTRF